MTKEEAAQIVQDAVNKEKVCLKKLAAAVQLLGSVGLTPPEQG
jgi:hypothetical protein